MSFANSCNLSSNYPMSIRATALAVADTVGLYDPNLPGPFHVLPLRKGHRRVRPLSSRIDEDSCILSLFSGSYLRTIRPGGGV